MSPEFESGRYRLQERLTPESNSWLAEDLEDPVAAVVVKVLPQGADILAARHLVDKLSSVETSALNKPIDHGELPDGRPFLVYRFAEGSTLREFLNASGPLPLSLAGNLVWQLGQALAVLHRERIVYGILAPEHILIQNNRGKHTAVLLNVGSFQTTSETSASPAYLAPEQLAGSPVLRSDVFSLGALAAEMLTGRRAFRYGSLAELGKLQRIGLARGSLRKLRGKIPLRAEEEIRRATSWEAAQRPTDIEVFGSRVAEYLGPAGVFQKRRMLLAALVIALMAAFGIRNCRRRWAGRPFTFR